MSQRKRAKLIAQAFRNVVQDRHLIEQFDFELRCALDENGVEPIVWVDGKAE